MLLAGTPSDDATDVLATGDGAISTAFVSMSTRHPTGADAEYLRWHTLDHRPEQYRLSAVRASLRLVSTPACRAARAVSRDRFDPVDHVMTYFFTDVAGIDGFLALGATLRNAGRMLPLLPPVERGVYGVRSKVSAPRVKIGADVLPWWPIRGAYLLAELADTPAPDSIGVTGVEGVVGVWSVTALDVDPRLSGAPPGQRLTYVFLDDDPVDAAERLRPILEERWNAGGVEPLLAAPFHVVVPHQWDCHVP